MTTQADEEAFAAVCKACKLDRSELEQFMAFCHTLGLDAEGTFNLLAVRAQEMGNELRLEAGLFDRTGKNVVEIKKALPATLTAALLCGLDATPKPGRW